MIEPIYVVYCDGQFRYKDGLENPLTIELANEIADSMARDNPGHEVHVCRTIRVIKAAKPELAPIQELSVGPGEPAERPTTRPSERQSDKCLHLDPENPEYCTNHEKVGPFFTGTAGVTGKNPFVCEGTIACYKTCPEYKE